jgi:hypothetical protein
MAVIYSNGHGKYQPFPTSSKIYPNWDLKKYHLATLLEMTGFPVVTKQMMAATG